MQNLNDVLAEIRILLGEQQLLNPEQKVLLKKLLEKIKASNYEIINEQKLDEFRMVRQMSKSWEDFIKERGISFEEETQTETIVVKMAAHKWYRSSKWMTAAAIIIVFVGATFMYQVRSRGRRTEQIQVTGNKPGFKQTMLYLADNTAMLLQDQPDGKPVKQGSMQIHITQDGELKYQPGTLNQAADTGYNRIETARGGEYKVILADGTNVWLNAASTLRFPVCFAATERVVELTGEAYFEVAKNAAKPFIVKTKHTVARVLGTHFNINAYANEPSIKTTLLEGSIQINTGRRSVLLKPGQQATVKDDEMKIQQNIDTEKVIAWKKGFFYFNDEKLSDIIRSLERWYDVKVTYGEGVEDKRFIIGRISRNEKITKPLTILSLTGTIHFDISKDEKQVFISK